MRIKAHARSGQATAALLISAVGAALIVYGLVVAFVIQPPVLGWVGFSIVAVVVLALAALAPLAFERTRVSARPPADAVDRERRLLVIADPQCSAIALRDEIVARLAGTVAVHLVVPVRVSHLHFLTDDESDEQREAELSMRISVRLLQQRGVSTSGAVGSDKPLESLIDALASFAATQVLLATPPEDESYWLERDLLAKARPLINIPITHVVVVPSASSLASTPEARGAARV